MIDNKLLQYFDDQKKLFFYYFALAGKTGAMDDVHELRTTIKRLSLLYRIFDFASGMQFNYKSNAVLLRKIFKTGACLRDIQVYRQLLVELSAPDVLVKQKLTQYFNQQENQLKEEYINTVANIRIEDINLNFTLAKGFIEQILLNIDIQVGVINFQGQVHDKISELSGKLKSDVNYHELRKFFKMLYYIKEIELGEDISASAKANLLKEMGSNLGEWHDFYCFNKMLNSMNQLITIEESLLLNQEFETNMNIYINEFYSQFDLYKKNILD